MTIIVVPGPDPERLAMLGQWTWVYANDDGTQTHVSMLFHQRNGQWVGYFTGTAVVDPQQIPEVKPGIFTMPDSAEDFE